MTIFLYIVISSLAVIGLYRVITWIFLKCVFGRRVVAAYKPLGADADRIADDMELLRERSGLFIPDLSGSVVLFDPEDMKEDAEKARRLAEKGFEVYIKY